MTLAKHAITVAFASVTFMGQALAQGPQTDDFEALRKRADAALQELDAAEEGVRSAERQETAPSEHPDDSEESLSGDEASNVPVDIARSAGEPLMPGTRTNEPTDDWSPSERSAPSELELDVTPSTHAEAAPTAARSIEELESEAADMESEAERLEDEAARLEAETGHAEHAALMARIRLRRAQARHRRIMAAINLSLARANERERMKRLRRMRRWHRRHRAYRPYRHYRPYRPRVRPNYRPRMRPAYQPRVRYRPIPHRVKRRHNQRTARARVYRPAPRLYRPQPTQSQRRTRIENRRARHRSNRRGSATR